MSQDVSLHDLREAALLLLSLGNDAGGRVDPERISARREGSLSRRAYGVLLQEEWVDMNGWVTNKGREALRAWEVGE